ncbi:MAG: methyltransferase [Chitinophagaceae bacterium]|nr:methyltransferase [Chitinophagaceae bacterium]
MRRIARFFTTIFYKPLLIRWLSKERDYLHDGIRLSVHPQVFHPGFFFSTKLLLKQVSALPLEGKTFLELGAGSGLISISAAQQGAAVTASDINPVAVSYLKRNAAANQVSLSVVESDLFSAVPPRIFDIIAINPPYYFQTPVNWKEYAWYCGKNGEYFAGLFAELGNYVDRESVILMVLCDGVHRTRVQQIANERGFELECVKQAGNLLEKNFIYRIHPQ